VGVAEDIAPSVISMFPNPTHSTFTLTLPPTAGSCTLRIHDITGRQVGLRCTYHVGDAPVDVEALPAGLYFVEVNIHGKTEVIKLVKQ